MIDNEYSTLFVLAGAVRELPNPTAYLCTPREMILRCAYDWATIYHHLLKLEEQGLVQIVNTDTIQFSITQIGLDRAVFPVEEKYNSA